MSLMRRIKSALYLGICVLLFSGISRPSIQEGNLDEFLSKVETALESNDVNLYLTALSPDLRKREGLSITSYLENFGFETISIFKSGMTSQDSDQAYVFFLLDGIASGVFALSLIVLGIGTLRLATWARVLSIAWSVLYLIWFVFLSVLEPVDFDELGVLLLLYPITVLYLFNTRQWKMIFCRAA